MNERGSLAKLLKGLYLNSPMVVARNKEERTFLEKWLTAPKERVSAQTEDLSPIAEGADMREIISLCNRCANIADRKQPYGSGENGIMIILNPPSMMSATEKKIYKNESADLLKKMLASVNITMEKSYITSMIKCESSELINQGSRMFASCERILQRELELMKPKIVVVLGDFLPLKKTSNRFRDIFWQEIDHPITLIKNPERKKHAYAALLKIKSKYEEPDPA